MFTVLAGILLIGVEVATTMSTTIREVDRAHRYVTGAAHIPVLMDSGEPQITHESAIPPGPRIVAARFVRDYTLWNDYRLRAIPPGDVTARVGELIEREIRQPTVAHADPVGSVRIARAGRGRYLVTSAVGNFLVGARASRWRVVSLPGD